jgi:arsenate reductase-like glutaredoxin family protein
MLSGVLTSPPAIAMNIAIMRAFVQLCEILGTNKAIASKLNALEKRLSTHDEAINEILEALRALMANPDTMNRPIGFTADLEEPKSKKR